MSTAQGNEENGRSRATLRDIATALDLDVSTVSKVLNGTIIVRPETRERVLREARRLRYQPNAAARAIKTRKTEAMGLLIPDLRNPIYAQIARGAVQQAEEDGFVMFLAEIDDEDGTFPHYRKLVLESRVDGLIVATARDASKFMDELAAGSTSYVFANRRVPDSQRSVFLDDEAGGALAAKTLIEAGHARLGLIGGPPSVDTARRRRSGFEAECATHSLPSPVVATGPYTLSGGAQAMKYLLEQVPRPTSVFASNTLSGLGALHSLLGAGLRVPDDISLITFDDDMAAFTNPPLTAIRMPLVELGSAAVTELGRLLDGLTPRDVRVGIAPQLVWRDSVAPPSA